MDKAPLEVLLPPFAETGDIFRHGVLDRSNSQKTNHITILSIRAQIIPLQSKTRNGNTRLYYPLLRKARRKWVTVEADVYLPLLQAIPIINLERFSIITEIAITIQ